MYPKVLSIVLKQRSQLKVQYHNEADRFGNL
jgi:hypothetical protein